MKCKVASTLIKYKMLPESGKVIVALSGGADSMALLHILNELKADFHLTLAAAHINHGIRGAAADEDEDFVRRKCAEIGVPLYAFRADVPALAAERGEGLEECGRRVRYDFFASIGENAVIATAHNSDDRAETFLLNFTRGASLRGLCSIPYVRGNIVRPLLDCTKSEVLQYCENNGVEFVTDLTNEDIAYSRNRIRSLVMPQLRAVNPAADKSAARCIASLCEDNALLELLTDELICSASSEKGYGAKKLAGANPALTKRAVSRIIERETGVTAPYDAICGICDMLDEGGSVQLAEKVFVRVRKGILDFPEYSEHTFEEIPLCAGISENREFTVTTRIIIADETECLQIYNKKLLEYRVDCDKICGKAVLRSRLPGDSIKICGRGCTKTLKKLFNESCVPPEKRNGLCVAADEAGLIFVEGFGVSERCAVTPQTKRVMKTIIERKLTDA